MPSEDSSIRASARPAQPASAAVINTLLLAVAVLWCIYWFVHAWHYWEDDAYIHLEFARSLAAGRGFAFNGHVVAGDTAPLWVFLLAGMHALVPDWLVAGKLLTVLGAAVGFSGTYAFARRLASSFPVFPGAAVFPAAMVLLIAVNPYTCYWIFSGMEPIAAAGLAFWAALAATRQPPSTKTFLIGCLLAGIAPLVRPEMLFLTALLAFPLLAQWRRIPSSAAAVKSAALVAGVVLICSPVALWSLYSLHAFGHLLPNTNAAKRAAPSDSVMRHLLSIYAPGFPLILCGVLAGALYLILNASAVRRSLQRAVVSTFNSAAPDGNGASSRSLPLAGWIFVLWALVTTVFYIADHTYVQTRYILVTAPGLTIVIMALALVAFRSAGRVLYVLALLAAILASVVTVRPFIRNKAINCQSVRNLALFIRDRIPPTAPVAAYAIGELAFDSEHPIVDTGGITRPGAIPYLNASPEAMLRWARSVGAQYFIGSKPEPDATLVFSESERFIGWTLHPSRYANTIPLELWQLAPQSSGPLQQHEAAFPALPDRR